VAPSAIRPRPRRAPVRVKLDRMSCDYGVANPPDDLTHRDWADRLAAAFGTGSSDFVQASLHHLTMAARLPGGGVSELAVNAAIAFVEGAKPRDEVEAALVVQMAATHCAAMAVLRRLGGGHGGDRSVVAMATAASRLLRAYATQVEALRRLRNGGSQVIRIEHVHVGDGGRAIVGMVHSQESEKEREQCLERYQETPIRRSAY
jgi:hypothetical protein